MQVTKPRWQGTRLAVVLRWLAVAGSAALLAAGCGASSDSGSQADQQAGSPNLGHVHGLGINPADGQLYVASHHGLFLVTEQDRPEQIAGLTQDFMGFTVAGPDHFLASGHPGPQDPDLPPHLGLIESTDAGQTWQSVSLSGEVDFHALEAAHGAVYGYDSQSGQIMVSTDQHTWDRRAALSLADIAVSPAEPEIVLATTEQGPMQSTDGGNTFAPISDAPILVFVDWLAADRLLGVAPDGTVYASGDAGTSWTKQSTVSASPQAILAHGESDVYVATAEAIHRSSDNGKTFQVFQTLN